MGAFSKEMRQVAVDLMKDLGSSCVLTKVTKGEYDTTLGEAPETKQDFPTYSAPIKKMSVVFPDNGSGTNLDAFDSNRITVPWIGQEIDTTWLYNGFNIVSAEPVETQNDIVIYNILVGEK